MEPWIIVVILGAAAIVYALMLPKRQAESNSADKMVKEVEATLEQYMADIENENVELVELISQMKQDTAARQLAQQEQLTEMRQRLIQLEQQSFQSNARLSAAESGLLQIPSTILTEARVNAAAAEEGHAQTEIIKQQLMQENEEKSTTVSAEPSIKERYTELFELYSQGKSIDVIGKMTGMHRGEVQLILQLAKQEESL